MASLYSALIGEKSLSQRHQDPFARLLRWLNERIPAEQEAERAGRLSDLNATVPSPA